MEAEPASSDLSGYASDAASPFVPSSDADLGSPDDRSTPLPSDVDDLDPDSAAEHGDHDAGAAALDVDDLKRRIIKQVEYYFSDENLPTDKYMLSVMKKNKEGFIPIGIIASFRKMKKLSRDHGFISAALKESALLVVSPDGKRVRRLNPLPAVEVRDPKLFTVLVENLPEDHSVENLCNIFGEVGKVKKISIYNPNATEEEKKGHKIFYSSKLHALVEYETVESAEKAVTTLNNEEDWRNGMRVKLLKGLAKYGQRRQARAGSEPDKKTNGHIMGHARNGENNSSVKHEHHEETPDEEDGDHIGKERNDEIARNHGRGRRHKHRGPIGHGHGVVAAPQVVEASKPPPGPKMPDGTRGFAMGRGRPL